MPLAEVEDNRIIVRTEFRDRDLIRVIPGARYDTNSHAWSVSKTWSSCLTLRGVFRERLELGPGLIEWAGQHREKFILPALEMRYALDAPGDSDLYPFQRAGVQFLRHARHALLTDDMGTGKTVQTIRTLHSFTHDLMEDTFPMLVVCPNNVKGTWLKEFNRWWPQVKVEVLDGGRAQRLQQIKRVAEGDAQVLVANWEALRHHSRLNAYGSIRLRHCHVCDRSMRDVWQTAKDVMEEAEAAYSVDPKNDELSTAYAVAQDNFKKADKSYGQQNCERCPRELNRIEWSTIAADEAHRMKDPKSKQARALWALRTEATEFRYALTGTPIADTPQDLWAALHFIDPEQFPSKNAFIERWCLTTYNPFGGMTIVGLKPETRDEFFAITDPHVRRMPKDLVLSQLPAKVYSSRFVDMAPKQKKAYDAMAADMLAMIGDAGGGERLVAVNPLTQLTRLTQFSSAYAELDDQGDVHLTDPSNKIDALMEIIEEAHGKPLVVFAQSRQLIELASAKLTKNHIGHGLIVGGQYVTIRQKFIDDFQAGRYPVMLVTIQAGGIGITLTRADTAVFLQRSWSMIDNSQAEDRIHRIGSEIHEAIHIIDIISTGTIEEGQRVALNAKEERMQEVVRDAQAIARLVKEGVA